MNMKLFKLTQDAVFGWDTYDSCVVCARDADSAKSMHPDGRGKSITEQGDFPDWATNPKDVQCEYIGESIYNDRIEPFVVVASFNAG